ncbi:MAG: NAD(+)/NADH kinase [Candidatus Heimdallarchaeaceae archaeon]
MLSKDSLILLVASKKNSALNAASDALSTLIEKGYKVALSQILAKDLKKKEFVIQGEQPDLIIVFGGDGTILKTFTKWKQSPILGVNCGRVGFLTEIYPEELNWAIEKLTKEEYIVEQFTTVAVSSDSYPTLSAVNDIIIAPKNPGNIMKLKVEINDKLFYVIEGDGVIVSTSAGSSAYARSAGGPLIMPDVDAFCLVPICPFIVNVSPLVLSPDTVVKVTNEAEFRTGIVIVDGLSHYTLEKDEHVIITKSKEIIRFIRFSENYIKRVRKKLLERIK